MNFLRRNMFWTFTILAGLFQIFAIIFGILATNADKKESKISIPSTTYNIQGNFVNRDKNLDTIKNKKTKKIDNKKPMMEKEPIINNGIINSGTNNGTQTVNNIYNQREKRSISNEDVNYIKQNIPLDYNIIVFYVNSTQESVNYAQEIISELKVLGYNIIGINQIGMFVDGRPYSPEERFYIERISEKEMKMIIREQK